MKQKTLFITSIYSNLWGTEFGGRSSRYHHYRQSLLTILRMNPTKVICFTPEDEFSDLENFFYVQNSIDKNLLELKIFDLKKSKYFNIISEKKDVEVMKTFDRCFEIQYNKFFWVENIPEINEYEKVYWFDAGLSHSGLFPECFAEGNGYDRNFRFNLFNENYLEILNDLSENKFIIVGKNNTNQYYWSTTIPQKYYENFSMDLHIIGGFFGGNRENYLELVDKFDKILSKLLSNESSLYMEEQILSHLYYENKDFFHVLTFDGWYQTDKNDSKTKYFYEIFVTSEDCNKNDIVSLNVEEKESEIFEIKNNLDTFKKDSTISFLSSCLGKDKIESTKKLIESVLTDTNYDFILLTDLTYEFADYGERLLLIPFSDFISDVKGLYKFPYFHVNRHLFYFANQLKYDYMIFCENSVHLENWDSRSFEDFLSKEFDISFVKSIEPQLKYLVENFKPYQEILEKEINDFYDESLVQSPNPESYFFIVKNNEKLESFLKNWETIDSKNNFNYPTYSNGFYLGLITLKSQMMFNSVEYNKQIFESIIRK